MTSIQVNPTRSNRTKRLKRVFKKITASSDANIVIAAGIKNLIAAKKAIAARIIHKTKLTHADIQIISTRLASVNSSIVKSISKAFAILNTQSQKS